MKTAYSFLNPVLVVLLGLLFAATNVFAAPPDGSGPWADSVESVSQGLRKDSSPVLPIRSNANAAIGVAENNTVEGNFFSLGFGGNIVLKFDNPISNGVVTVEATNVGYVAETAKIELSADGTSWFLAGSVSQDGQVPMPSQLSCAKYVRITDTSTKDLFPDDADGYDVDGVKTIEGQPCQFPTPTPENDCCCSKTNVTVSGNGSGSTVTIGQKTIKALSINQSAVTSISNITGSSAKSGKVSVKNNTGSAIKVKTGSTLVGTAITTLGSSNIAKVVQCCE